MAGFQSRRRAGSLFRRIGILLIGLAVIWFAGLVGFANSLPTAIQDPGRRTDAIVVLTGGSGRLEEGLSLLARDQGERLFISGVYQGVDVKTLFRMFKRNPTDLETRVSIGTATNTTGNATETAQWITGKGIDVLRLVTASYHMPRSLLEFRHAMPEVKIIAHPVFPEHVKTEQWWAWPGTATLILGEYNKFILAWLRNKVTMIVSGKALNQ